MSNVMKECCGLCPYSRKNTLFLSPDRAEEFAYAAENRYNDFVCHKTGVGLEDNESDDLGGSIVRREILAMRRIPCNAAPYRRHRKPI